MLPHMGLPDVTAVLESNIMPMPPTSTYSCCVTVLVFVTVSEDKPRSPLCHCESLSATTLWQKVKRTPSNLASSSSLASLVIGEK